MVRQVTVDRADAGGVTDGDLVERCRRGESAAFTPLFERYARQVYNIAYRYSGDPTEAEDLTQEAFLRAFRALPTLRDSQAFARWLYHIATNICVERLRRAGRATLAPLTDTHADDARWASPPEVALSGEDSAARSCCVRCRSSPTPRSPRPST